MELRCFILDSGSLAHQSSASFLTACVQFQGAGLGMEPAMHCEELLCLKICGLYVILWPFLYSHRVFAQWQGVAVYCLGLVLSIELAS